MRWIRAGRSVRGHDTTSTATRSAIAAVCRRSIGVGTWHGTGSRDALIYQHMTSDRNRAIADRLGAMIPRGEGT